MRGAVLAIALAACGPAPAPTTPVAAPTPAPTTANPNTRIVPLIPAGVTMVSDMGDGRAMLDPLRGVGVENAACLDALRTRVVRAYGFNTSSRDLQNLILEGDLTRSEVAACLPNLFSDTHLAGTVGEDGAFLT